MASHPVLLLILAVVGIVLFTIFYLNTAATWGITLRDKHDRLTSAEWLDRMEREAHDAD